MRNNRLLNIVSVLTIVVLLIPIYPYKRTVFNRERYEKLQVDVSYKYGIILLDNCDDLGLSTMETIDDYLIGFDEVASKICKFKNSVENVPLALYGEYKEDENGEIKFYIEDWTSRDLCLKDTYIFGFEWIQVYVIILIPDLVILIICIMLKIVMKREI